MRSTQFAMHIAKVSLVREHIKVLIFPEQSTSKFFYFTVCRPVYRGRLSCSVRLQQISAQAKKAFYSHNCSLLTLRKACCWFQNKFADYFLQFIEQNCVTTCEIKMQNISNNNKPWCIVTQYAGKTTIRQTFLRFTEN